MTVRVVPAAALALSMLLGLASCGEPDDGDRPGAGYGSDGVVDGPLLTSVGTSEDGMLAQVTGRLAHDGQCLRLRGMPVIWPEGTSWEETTHVLTLPGGEAVAVGERVSGGGGYLDPKAIERLFGTHVADAARTCLGPTRETAVFNPGWTVSPASKD